MESPIVTTKVTYSGGGNYLWQWNGNGVSHKSQQMKFLDAATFDTSWEVKTELSARSYIESSLPKTALQNKR